MLIGTFQQSQRSSLIDLLAELADFYDTPHVMPSILEAVGPHRLQCNLKELYVTRLDRSAGVGSALLRWSARFALERGCGRLDWHVKAANAAGIRFYERHGAQLVADRLSYRLDGDGLASLAATEPVP